MPCCSVCGSTTNVRGVPVYNPYGGTFEAYGPVDEYFCFSCLIAYDLLCQVHERLRFCAHDRVASKRGDVMSRITQDMNSCCRMCVALVVRDMPRARRGSLLRRAHGVGQADRYVSLTRHLNKDEVDETNVDICTLYGLLVHANLLGLQPEEHLRHIGAH